LVDLLVQRARPFVFSTGLAPASAGALAAAIELAAEADAARAHVLALARALARALELPAPAAAIVPVPVGDANSAVRLRDELARAGFAVGAARPPTVAPGTSRLRIALHAHNTAEQVASLARAVRERLPEAPRAAAAPAPRRARVLTVVGTDTDVGKTVVSALLATALRRAGPIRYWKPVQTGTDSDTRTVESLAALAPLERAEPLYAFALPASPHTAAAAENARIEPQRVLARLAELRAELGAGTLVVELAGGLLVPLDEHATQADFLARAGGELVLVARSGLGTLNHTLLTLEALRARGLEPRALFLVGPPHASNRATLAARSGIAAIHEVPPLAPLDARSIEGWVDAHPLAELAR
ncbi:MAG: dethiobiotin synthase, partial [Planctomycetota bacterium]